MLTFPTEPVLVQLRADIEALATGVTDVTETHHGKESWGETIRGTRFGTICNGKIKGEGQPAAPVEDMESMARHSLSAARAFGGGLLTWRDFSYEPSGQLWIRLAFEPAG